MSQYSMKIDDELVNEYIISNSEKIRNFWNIFYDASKEASKGVFLLAVPLFFLLYLGACLAKIPSVVLYNITKILYFEFEAQTLIILWMCYILLVLTVLKIYVKNNVFTKTINEDYTKQLASLVMPAETAVIVSFELANELIKYIKYKIPPDLGLGSYFDDVEKKYLYALRGRSTVGHSPVRSNSFFIDLKTSTDIESRLGLCEWYVGRQGDIDILYENLLKIAHFINTDLLNGDYKFCADILKKTAEVLILAIKKNSRKFKEGLTDLLNGIEEYRKTKSPLLGVPLLVVRICKLCYKNVHIFIGILGSLLLAIIAVTVVPIYITSFILSKFSISISTETIRLVIFGSLTIFSLYMRFVQK